MITAALMGGLGNYMFQIAAAESIAKDLRTDAIFDLNRVAQSQRHINHYLNNIFQRVKFGTPIPKYLFNERGFAYEEIPTANDLHLYGYFQSEKYFQKHTDYIRSLFWIEDDRLKNIIGRYVEPCSIHVRRGDYLKYPNKHYQLSADYYQSAIELIKSEEPNTQFLVFSDDIEWCKQTFIGNEFHFITGNEDYEDMILMSMCRRNIITNSTFSWWGAWLGEFDDKTIISPEKWFGPEGPQDQQDIIPNRWKKLR